MKHNKFRCLLNRYAACLFTLMFFSWPVTSASESIWFPDGAEFVNIQSVDKQIQAWTTCAVLNQMLSELNKNINPELSSQRGSLLNAQKFIIMVTRLSANDTEQKDMKAIIRSADELIDQRLEGMLKISKESKDEDIDGLFDNSVSTCERNSIFASKIMSEFTTKSKLEGSKEYAFLRVYHSQ